MVLRELKSYFGKPKLEMELSNFLSFLTGIVLHVWNWMLMMMIIIIITNVWAAPVAAGTKTGVFGCSFD